MDERVTVGSSIILSTKIPRCSKVGRSSPMRAILPTSYAAESIVRCSEFRVPSDGWGDFCLLFLRRDLRRNQIGPFDFSAQLIHRADDANKKVRQEMIAR